SRRWFIRIATLGVVSFPAVASGQGASAPLRIGWLSGAAAADRRRPNFDAFAKGLGESGYVHGQNVSVDLRKPDGEDPAQYRDLAHQLVAGNARVILAANPLSLEAVTKATKTIPVVGVDLESDPIRRGWAASLARPGANVTGFFLDIPEMSG